jgi:hypothetical protein
LTLRSTGTQNSQNLHPHPCIVYSLFVKHLINFISRTSVSEAGVAQLKQLVGPVRIKCRSKKHFHAGRENQITGFTYFPFATQSLRVCSTQTFVPRIQCALFLLSILQLFFRFRTSRQICTAPTVVGKRLHFIIISVRPEPLSVSWP